MVDPPSVAASSSMERVQGWIDAAQRITVLTGAGISTESGIPDFRGPNGMWTKNPKAERTSNIHFYVEDPEVRKLSWQQRLNHPGWSAKPNAGHRALVELERRGKLAALITQNIDGLHQAAGSSPELVVEVHGTMREVVCLSCDDRAPMQVALDRVRAGEVDPPCRSCGGILKSATVSFGQSLDPVDLERSEHAAAHCDLLLAVGTTLTVYPIAAVPLLAKRAGALVVTLNDQPTNFDDRADAVLKGSIGDILPALIGS